LIGGFEAGTREHNRLWNKLSLVMTLPPEQIEGEIADSSKTDSASVSSNEGMPAAKKEPEESKKGIGQVEKSAELSTASSLDASPVCSQTCDTCARQAALLFLDTTDGGHYCRECWKVYYGAYPDGEGPNVAAPESRPTATSASNTPKATASNTPKATASNTEAVLTEIWTFTDPTGSLPEDCLLFANQVCMASSNTSTHSLQTYLYTQSIHAARKAHISHEKHTYHTHKAQGTKHKAHNAQITKHKAHNAHTPTH
jgi:hypothetical protein